MSCDETIVAVRPSRRSFLKAAGATSGALLAGPAALQVFSGLEAPAFAADALSDPLSVGTPILVLIDLMGGNDCLNTLVPVTDPWYYDATYGHGSLAIPANQTLPLDATTYRLNNKMPWLGGAWNATRNVAFVVGVGENVTNQFSHFEAQDQWYTCDFTGQQHIGWLGRFNDARHTSQPLASICVSGLHPVLVGETCHVLSVGDVGGFEMGVHWRGIWTAPGLPEAMEMLRSTGASGPLGDAQRMVDQTYTASSTIKATYDEALLGGLDDWFAWELMQAALMIRGGVPCQTYVAGLGGFDTHSGEREDQDYQLGRLDAALSRFWAALSGHPRRRDVVMLIYSEFGRKVTVNDTGGTDHGQAGMAILIGDRVKRGIYGQQPTLDPGGSNRPNRIYDAMRPTVDFRSVFYSAVNFLGEDENLSEAVIGSGFSDIGAIDRPIHADGGSPLPPVVKGPEVTDPPARNPPPPQPRPGPEYDPGTGDGAGTAVSPSPGAAAVASTAPTPALPPAPAAPEFDVFEAARDGADALERGAGAARP